MLLLPMSLSAIAQEHGGTAVKKKVSGLQTSAPANTEHGGEAAKHKEHAAGEAEHGGEAAKKKVPGLMGDDHAATASEHGGTAVKKKTAEHAGEAAQ